MKSPTERQAGRVARRVGARYVPRLRRGSLCAWGFGFGSALLSALGAGETAHACGATCAVPELWDVQRATDGALSVVTNFGLMHEGAQGWSLSCELAVGGGLITSAVVTPLGHYVSTTEGLFVERGECEYEAVPLGVGDEWPLAFTSLDLGAAAHHYALVLDAETDRISVVHGVESEPFEVLTSFDRALGFRQIDVRTADAGHTEHASDALTARDSGAPGALEAGAGEAALPWVFVSGQTASPRVWHVAWRRLGLDGGVDERADAGGASAGWEQRSIELEAETTLAPLPRDPRAPAQLLLRAETPPGQPGELWSFDAHRGELERLHVLEGSEQLVALVATADSWLLFGNDEMRGVAYRAPRGTTDFALLDVELPRLSCARAYGEDVYLCGADFTRGSPFVLARSSDEASSFEPLMTLAQLGVIDACAGACDDTKNWLRATYGSVGVGTLLPSPEDAGRVSLDAGSGGSADAAPDDGSELPPPRDAGSNGHGGAPAAEQTSGAAGCGCALAGSGSRKGWLLFAGVTLLCGLGRLAARRGRRSVPR